MKILYLGKPSRITHFLGVDRIECGISAEYAKDFDWLISYGYRHILKKEILDLFPDRAINLHISYLPWNRGADPNLWSFLEDTPKGVTIHYMDEGLDTGDIIYQQEVEMDEDDTLATSYQKLSDAIEGLFIEKWESILSGDCPRIPQGQGSYHRSSDKDIFGTIPLDTSIGDLYGRRNRTKASAVSG